MSSVWAEQHRLHHPLIPKNRGGVDIPPRKLLSHRAAAEAAAADMFMDSPRGFEQFLPYNSESDDSDSDPYSSDHFRMYEFKVRRCTRTRSHDWTDCPFTHPGEKARRRDPRRFHYSGTVCSEYRRGSCSRGDNCEFAHGVFESWLHPSRYRTEACKDGKNCKRKVCFFAHSQRELRILPFQADDSPADPTDTHRSSASSAVHQLTGHCCMYCHHQPSAAISSPTSTLMGLSHLSSPPVSPSHSLSPPLSPAKYRSSLGGASSLSPASRYADQLANSVSYRNLLSEIIGSLDVMKVADVSSGDPRNKRSFPRVDTVFPGDDQTQFVLSPAAPSPAPMSARDPFRNFRVDYDDNARDGLAAASDPDLGWVNELLT